MQVCLVAHTRLALTALVCLPRQFQVAVVEGQNVADLRVARGFFGGYLVLISLMVVPIALAGAAVLDGTGVSPDTYVLALPLARSEERRVGTACVSTCRSRVSTDP